MATRKSTVGLRKVLEGVADENGIRTSDLVVGLGEKSCNEVDSIRWVANNMRSTVKASDAPSGVAWELLMLCRESISFRADFYKSMWTKLLPKTVEPDERVDDSYDGMELVDVISKLQSSVCE